MSIEPWWVLQEVFQLHTTRWKWKKWGLNHFCQFLCTPKTCGSERQLKAVCVLILPTGLQSPSTRHDADLYSLCVSLCAILSRWQSHQLLSLLPKNHHHHHLIIIMLVLRKFSRCCQVVPTWTPGWTEVKNTWMTNWFSQVCACGITPGLSLCNCKSCVGEKANGLCVVSSWYHYLSSAAQDILFIIFNNFPCVQVHNFSMRTGLRESWLVGWFTLS